MARLWDSVATLKRSIKTALNPFYELVMAGTNAEGAIGNSSNSRNLIKEIEQAVDKLNSDMSMIDMLAFDLHDSLKLDLQDAQRL